MYLFKDGPSDDTLEALRETGLPAAVARKLQSHFLRKQAVDFPDNWPGVSPRLIERVRSAARVPHLTLIDAVVSPQDGFKKYLFRGEGDGEFEAVRIPLLHRPGDEKYVVCVSSQVGCAMGCRFCATGRMGFRRNLATWEIVDQVLKIQADSTHPVRGVVFMGMGEPFLNYDRVIRAARVFSEPCGPAIDAKSITISTVGIVPAIRRFTAEGHPYKLIVSLTQADTAKRRELFPIEDKYPLDDLLAALRDHHAVTGKRITLAWTMLGGINTSPEEVDDLVRLTEGLPVLLDLIDVNDATGEFRRPTSEELSVFRDALRAKLSNPVTRRYSGGLDIHGACGMLAAVRGGPGD
jgi:23S rRNA (adenine2503-C2)-methyltransferase